MEEKWVGKSKTVLSVVLSTLVLWAPQVGFDFTGADKTFLEEQWNEVLASMFAAFAVYGRVAAKAQLKWM